MCAQFGTGFLGGEFRWNDGSLASYTKWFTNQPKLTADKYPKQDCVKVRGTNGLWSAVDCSKNTDDDGVVFVCERLPTC
jgi:hypothetical protein